MKSRTQKSEREEPQKGAALLVAAARRLFLDQGYANVSMQAIATEAGMTKGAPYYHFPSKEALFLEVSRQVVATLREGVNAALALDVPLRERLTAAMSVVVNASSDDLSTWLTDLKLIVAPEAAMGMVSETLGSFDISDIFLPAFAQAAERDEPLRVSPDAAARVLTRLMLSCMEECSYWRLTGLPQQWDPIEAVADSIDIFLHGAMARD